MMVEGYAWVVTTGISGLLGFVRSPRGVLGLAPYAPPTPRLRGVRRRWAQRFMLHHRDADPAEAEMGCYALWAYDAAWAVASAVDHLGPGDLSSPSGLVGGKRSPTDFSGLGKSNSGKKFLAAIANTTFDGLSGRFRLVAGELTVPPFRVLNIMDNAKERSIRFWTPENGLTRRLGSGTDRRLGPVIWPSDSTVVPSGWGWVVPERVDSGYRPIVHLDVDPATKRTVAGGLAIKLFEAAVSLLPYALPFEYVPVPSMPYDSLIKNISLGVSASTCYLCTCACIATSIWIKVHILNQTHQSHIQPNVIHISEEKRLSCYPTMAWNFLK
jgi:glutamate receptor, ionotropic, plant